MFGTLYSAPGQMWSPCAMFPHRFRHQQGGHMTRRLLVALAGLSVVCVLAPSEGHAQTFKVEKFDIKGNGGTDYVTVESATGRVFVSRSDHMMVVEGATGKVLGDLPNTPASTAPGS
jgi:hypothetical protein